VKKKVKLHELPARTVLAHIRRAVESLPVEKGPLEEELLKFRQWYVRGLKKVKVTKTTDLPKIREQIIALWTRKPKIFQDQECYDNARVIAETIPGAEYVQGIVVHDQRLIHHAWNCHRGYNFDWTWGELGDSDLSETVYFECVRLKKVSLRATNKRIHKNEGYIIDAYLRNRIVTPSVRWALRAITLAVAIDV
jgi:hypothetical protein